MKTIIIFLIVLLACLSVNARTVDLYYSEDGKTVKSIHGFFINDNFTISTEGDESWLVVAGQKIGPNGYTPKESKLQLGEFGKSHSLFQLMTEDFLGYGHNKRFERTLSINDIAYVLPDSVPYQPLHVYLNTGAMDGQLFVSGDFTESTGKRVVLDKVVSEISIIRLKYDIPRSQRGPDTRPQQFGIKAKVIAFTETGLRRGMKALEDMQ
jgi:hypothetical protein